ncbi:MAG: exodeoxyribonuclease VII small subunit [Clostridia bacterium]|nr:exodeoxyribonuclease VII small subunit [Clostridia bacterium]
MSENKIDFETALKELKSIADKLEDSNTTLDESVKLFEKGMKLSRECSDILSTAKQKIISLTEAENEENYDD